MGYQFSQYKLPRGLSYPLKRSILDAALTEAGIQHIDSVGYFRTPDGNVVLSARYLGETKDRMAAGRAVLRVNAVPSASRSRVAELLKTRGLPALVRWLAELEAGGNAQRSMDHEFTVAVSGDNVTISES
jgi:hypothetical protein